MDHRFPKSARLLKRSDFQRVHDSAWFAVDHVLVLKGARNQLGLQRLGLAVSSRTGNAVVRNRWKRLIREAFREIRNGLPPGWDWVARPRRGATPELQAIRHSLKSLSRRIEKMETGKTGRGRQRGEPKDV